MATDVHTTDVAHATAPKPAESQTLNDFSRQRHDAAVLIPSGPPLGQWVFKLLTSELRGDGVPGAEAVKRGIEAVRETDPDFEPRYNPELLEQ
jgi:hypothetical protein